MLSPRRRRACALGVLALFLATSALPRASIYVHHHAAGDHEHVHPWGEDAFGRDDDQHDEHGHVHGAAAEDDGPGLEDPDGDHGTHVHWQAPFQHTAKSEAARLVCIAIAWGFSAALPLAAGVEPTPSVFARGPPPHSAA